MRLIIIFIVVLSANTLIGQGNKSALYLVRDTTKDEYAYLNQKGDTIIPFGKYQFCFTSTFDIFAIVSSLDKGIIGIDRNEKILFNVFIFDNGPDYLSDGLFRVVKNGKIGYADKNGHVIIKPKFDCAYPFFNGKAKVGNGCKIQTKAEHSRWTGGKWHFIDKHGQTLPG